MDNKKEIKDVKSSIDFEKEMIEVEGEESTPKHIFTKDSKSNKVQIRRIIVGGIFCILAAVGVMSIVTGTFTVGKKILSNENEKEYYNKLLYNLVMYDPLPFETPEQADKNILKYSSVWAAVMNEDMSVYETDEYGYTLLPSADVDKYLAKIFGNQIKLEHGSFVDPDEVDFVYNEEKHAYSVPATSYPVGYTPKVDKIKTTFSEKTVTVGYVAPQKSWMDTQEGSVTKYVDYIFEKQDGQYCLVAIRESDKKVDVPSNSETTEKGK